MMNKELIDLQKGDSSAGAIIQNEDVNKLESKILIKSNCSLDNLLKVFKEDLKNQNMAEYLVIEGIDRISASEQNKFYQIVKDREFCGYELPKDVVIVLTVEGRETLKNILPELYHLCIVAF